VSHGFAQVRLKEDIGTLPRFFYYFDERGSRYHEPIAPVLPQSEPRSVSGRNER